MRKLITIVLVISLQLSMVLAGHIYYSNNPNKVAIVVETSYGLAKYQNNILKTIEDLNSESRYDNFYYGTDKNYLGMDPKLESLFKVSFGKMDTDKIEELYPKDDYDIRYLLAFSDIKVNGWEVIKIGESK